MEQYKYNINCAIISIYPFPDGMAATNRILTYSKGMIANGANVDIFIPIPTHRYINDDRNENSGIYHGIAYYYTIGRYSSRIKLLRALSILSGYRFIIGYISTIIKLIKKNNKKKYNCIIISTDYLPYLFLFSIFAKLINVPAIFIFDEYPTPIRHKLKCKIPKWKVILYKITLNNLDAYISISQELSSYFNNFCKKSTFILPVIVDVTRFSYKKELQQQNGNSKYICYMGNMELSKDNVDNIIKSFYIISNRYPFIDLHLYGNPNQTNKTILEKLIEELDLKDRVILQGKISSSKVPEVLNNAQILVSSQPNTKRASGGFPTKLGEYLASGVPTLITDVGESSNYASDCKELFFARPDDPRHFAEKLAFIIDNYDFALKVGQNGKEHVMKNFSHINKGKEMLNFIKKIGLGNFE